MGRKIQFFTLLHFQLQIKVSNLENQLAQAQAENLRLLEEQRHSKKPPVGEKVI